MNVKTLLYANPDAAPTEVPAFMAFARVRARITGVREVKIGPQAIELQHEDGPSPSGQFTMGGPSMSFWWRDPAPIIARHSVDGTLRLLHSRWVAENDGRPPDGWELLRGDIVVELRGPERSTLRVGDHTFPEKAAA